MSDAYAANLGASADAPAPASPAPSAPSPASTPAPTSSDTSAAPVSEVDRMRAAINADPDARRAAAMMEGAKAARSVGVSIPTTEAASGVDPAVRLSQIEWCEKHDNCRFVVEDMAAERESLQAEMAKGPPSVRALSDADTASMISTLDGGAEMLAEWGDQSAVKIQAARNGAQAILNDLGVPANQAAFLGSFYGTVSKHAQVVITDALASGPPRDFQPASAESLRAFAQRPEGKALIDEWGSSAARKLGALNAWELAALKKMNGKGAESAASYSAWVGGLDDFTYRTIIRNVVRGVV